MNLINKVSLILIILLIVVLSGCGSNELVIYVSPDGNDDAKGTASKPIASLAYAAELARASAGNIPITIYLSGGYHYLKEPLKLSEIDGGTAEFPVQWKAKPGENPVISGGIQIKNWQQEKGGLWSAILPNEVDKNFRSFYINNKRAVRARFPDRGFLNVAKAGEDNRTNFFFEKGQIPEVENVKYLELAFMHDWSITRIGVKSIDWKQRHLTTVDSIGGRLPFFNITNWGEHPRYFLENAQEFCDSPGEWYCDFEERKIYYYPKPNENMKKAEGVIPLAEKLITITGTLEKRASFINFSGITFEHTNWQIPKKGYCGVQACMYDDRDKISRAWVPAAIELDLAENCQFNQCIIRHTGGSGIWIRENCLAVEISKCHIYDVAGNGINIGEGRDRLVNGKSWWQSVPEQVSKGNKISHSLIEDCGKQFYGAVGVWGGLIANTVIENNEIRNLPYTGISIGWMWNPSTTPCRENTINANHIHHIMNKLSDGGGIYCLGLQPKSRISNNLIHDVTVNAGKAESNGMFLDEGITDLIVENNIVYNIARSPLRFHKAFHNTVRNNVFVCGDDIPPIMYNRTKEEDIIKIDNVVLSQSSVIDLKVLDEIIEKRKVDIGPRLD